ncbi:tyrosine-type recombinase/integrase [Ferruginivarius sediminum]|uniref:Site-specific integrase n=1 Tax=Ferruginivarius sediminum TaxID=2661937 RepID=A0A369T8N1_9PROT|nr:site-specific integrase [Ferruginivarius sediminum]RDD61252.1 site-specific integrase [Ferruginivarius sediminum]
MDAPNTLADVLDRVQTDTQLTPRARQDMAWAIRHVGRALARNLADIPASPPILNNRLNAVAPAAAGISRNSWANARSRLRKSLHVTGCYIEPGRHKGELAPAWQDLLACIDEQWLRHGLSRFAHFASDNQWAPQEIDDSYFEAFLDVLENRSIARNPARTYRRACVNWNKAVREVPGWPQTEITIPCRDDGYTYGWEDFPAGLRQAVDAYFKARSGTDPFVDASLRPLAPPSIQGQRFQLRQFASAVVLRGAASCNELQDLPDLVQPGRVKAGLRFFYERNGQQFSSQLTQIANAVLGVARYLVQRGDIDQATFDAVHGAYKAVEYRPHGMAERNRERLRPFADPENVAKLLHLPDRLVAQRNRKHVTVRDAYRVRSALAIEILLVLPLRIRNLVQLRIDANIHRTQANGKGRTFIHIPGLEVKNGETLQVELPTRTAQLLDLYLTHYRPLLVRDNGDWLFPGQKGGHQHIAAFGTYLKNVIRRETGLAVHPHLFRHIAAKLYLRANPGQFEVVRHVLGHKRLKTTVDTYAEFDSHQAVEMYDKQILALREDLVGAAGDKGADHG